METVINLRGWWEGGGGVSVSPGWGARAQEKWGVGAGFSLCGAANASE